MSLQTKTNITVPTLLLVQNMTLWIQTYGMDAKEVQNGLSILPKWKSSSQYDDQKIILKD
jgi:hypothetical protein